MQNKPNSLNVQIYLNVFVTKDYQNFIPLAGQKNKPNSNPIKPNFQKAKMNVNLYVIEDYRKKGDFLVRKNKPNSNPIQTQSKPILKRMNVNFCVTRYYIYKIALSVNSYTPPLVRKINHFLVKSLPKIAENKVKIAFIVHKKAEKPIQTEEKSHLVRRLQMSWNLFEKIINAFRPKSELEQPNDVPDQSQPWPESSSEQSWPEGSTEQQSCPENCTEQPEASQEPPPNYQETPSAPQQNDWQQE